MTSHARIEELEEEVRQLKEMLSSQDEFIAAAKLSPRQRRLLLAIGRRPGVPVSADVLMSAAWPDRFVSYDNLKVTIHNLRERLRDLGVTIETRYGYGYLISEDCWSRLTGKIQ